jgi:hypothetical protein
MFMRLGFSVAIHVQPEVLLVDEVLAVGDIAFQLRCFDRMRQIQRSGATIVIVSHSMNAIRLLCPRVALLRAGQLEFDGDPETAIARHHQLLSVDAARGPVEPGTVVGGVRVLHAEVRDGERPMVHADQDGPLRFRSRLAFDIDIDSPCVFFDVVTEDGTVAYQMRSVIERAYHAFHAGDQAEVDVEFWPRLGGGTYRLVLSVLSSDVRTVHYRDPVGTLIYRTPPLGSSGIAALDATISVDGERVTDHDPVMFDRRV